MERKEFLIALFNKYIKPIFYLSICIYVFIFLLNAWKENSNERSLIVIGFVCTGIMLLLGIIKYVLDKICNSFSPKTKTFISIMNNSLKYLVIPFLLFTLYYGWNHNRTNTIGIFLVYSITYFFNFLKTTKSK